MWNQYSRYAQDRPLQGWLIMAVALLVFDLAVFAVAVSVGALTTSRPAPFMALVFSSLWTPTFMLMWRFSEEGRRERPIRPEQERGAGLASLGLLMQSVLAVGVGAAGLWLSWPRPVVAWAGVIAIIAVVLSGALGSAVRNTAAGRWGMQLACAWFALLFVTMFVVALVGRHALTGHA